MHKVTVDNEFMVRPYKGQWEATLIFYEKSIRISVVNDWPEMALAALWAKADEMELW